MNKVIENMTNDKNPYLNEDGTIKKGHENAFYIWEKLKTKKYLETLTPFERMKKFIKRKSY